MKRSGTDPPDQLREQYLSSHRAASNQCLQAWRSVLVPFLEDIENAPDWKLLRDRRAYQSRLRLWLRDISSTDYPTREY